MSCSRPLHVGRTGRFGRKGISVNFVHDKATWQQMEQIERTTGRQIIRIETTDLDTMEEVRWTFRGSISIVGSWWPPFPIPFAWPFFAVC